MKGLQRRKEEQDGRCCEETGGGWGEMGWRRHGGRSTVAGGRGQRGQRWRGCGRAGLEAVRQPRHVIGAPGTARYPPATLCCPGTAGYRPAGLPLAA